MAAEEELLAKIMQNQSNNSGLVGKEYLVRGASLKCSQGSQECIVKLPADHGKYIYGKPVLSSLDYRQTNIGGFGTCSNQKACQPAISGGWININENQKVFDQSVLKQVGIPHSGSYLICNNTTTGVMGEIDVVHSGQPANRDRKIPAGYFNPIAEDQKYVFPIPGKWGMFVAGQSGHYNINFEGETPITEVEVYKKGLFKKMSLIGEFSKSDFRPSQLGGQYYGRIELWLDGGETYYLTLGSDDPGTHNILIEGNLDQQVCNNTDGGSWCVIENARVPGAGFSVLQKTYWTKELTMELYSVLFDPNRPTGVFRGKRDDGINHVKSILITFLTYHFSGLITEQVLKKGAAAIANGIFTEFTGGQLGVIDLSKLERDSIYQNGNFIGKPNNNGYETSYAQNGIVLTEILVDWKQGTELRMTIEPWSDNCMKGEKYSRGFFSLDTKTLFRNLF